MIPRLKPAFDTAEIGAALSGGSAGDVAEFERQFAAKFEAAEAVAFPYGRTALKGLLNALELRDTEVIAPSYTCVVVQHATVLSGNVPVFVAAISPRTSMILATHLFGFPLDLDRFRAIVSDAEQRLGRKIWVVQDCAHAFGASWRGRLVCNEGDSALFGLNISKVMSSIFGGMLTFTDRALAARVRAWRDATLTPGSAMKSMLRLAYLAATYPAFQQAPYGLVHYLQYRTTLLDRLTKAYHLDEEVRFPPDAAEQMLPIEARVGQLQLKKYDWMIGRRRALAARYHAGLQGVPGWVLPPLVEGATYSHYPVRVPDRQAAVDHFARHGVHLGEVVEYSVAHLKAYTGYAAGAEFPNSLYCSGHMVNLPIHPQLSDGDADRVIAVARKIR
jgi:dTDP-4-amino-4,6-dideoxygalactose transaminase